MFLSTLHGLTVLLAHCTKTEPEVLAALLADEAGVQPTVEVIPRRLAGPGDGPGGLFARLTLSGVPIVAALLPPDPLPRPGSPALPPHEGQLTLLPLGLPGAGMNPTARAAVRIVSDLARRALVRGGAGLVVDCESPIVKDAALAADELGADPPHLAWIATKQRSAFTGLVFSTRGLRCLGLPDLELWLPRELAETDVGLALLRSAVVAIARADTPPEHREVLALDSPSGSRMRFSCEYGQPELAGFDERDACRLRLMPVGG